MPYFDVVNQHRYPSNFGTVTVETWLDQVRWMQGSADHPRPAYIGEYAVVGETATVRDPFGHYFHDGAWVPFFFAEAAGTNLIWRVDALFRPTSPTSDGYRAFGAFIRPEFKVLPSMKFYPPEKVTANVQVGKYANKERALLLFRDFDADPVKNNTRNQPKVEPFSYTLQGLADGDYVIEFWHTMSGEVLSRAGAVSTNGAITFDVPSFQRALAVKVYAGTFVPTPTPAPSATPAPTETAAPLLATQTPLATEAGSSPVAAPAPLGAWTVALGIGILIAASTAIYWLRGRKSK